MEQEEIKFDLDSKTEFKAKQDDDIMKLNDFLAECQCGGFIDYDGFTTKVIINGFVVYNDHLYPSEHLELKDKLLKIQEKHGEITVVWANR